MANVKKILPVRRRPRPEECDDDLELIQKAYMRLCRACVKLAVADGDILFFERKNPAADIIIDIARIDVDKCRHTAQENLEKRLFEEESAKRHHWNAEKVAHYFTGELTAYEISEVSGMSLAQVYRMTITHPEFRLKRIQGRNGYTGRFTREAN